MKFRSLLSLVLVALIPLRTFAADNIAVSPGSGAVVAADERTRNGIVEKQQVVVLGLGAEGTHDGFARMGQQTMANSLACVLPSDQTGIPHKAAATGGYTPGKLISAGSTNATNIKASAGTLGFLTVGNINAAQRYLKFYNKASAPTVGTDVPVLVFIVPGNTAGTGSNVPIPAPGINFSTGISFAITTGVADNDTGAVAANEITVNYGYN